MKSCASMKKIMTAALALLMVFACAVASAQTYRLYDEADEIATIQAALKQLKLYTGEITGHFGPKTETAVKTFQKRNDLVNDGREEHTDRQQQHERECLQVPLLSTLSVGSIFVHCARRTRI